MTLPLDSSLTASGLSGSAYQLANGGWETLVGGGSSGDAVKIGMVAARYQTREGDEEEEEEPPCEWPPLPLERA